LVRDVKRDDSNLTRAIISGVSREPVRHPIDCATRSMA
jgi:hypothetical protein